MAEAPGMKLVQICASQNDLFGLDDEGHVYQYNFNTSCWMHLGRGRSGQGQPLPRDGRVAIASAGPRNSETEPA